MTGQRQEKQPRLAFEAEGGPLPSAVAQEGVEPVMAKHDPESPALTQALMEEVCERENLKQALRRVKTNHGSPGIDGMSVEQLPAYLVRYAIRNKIVQP